MSDAVVDAGRWLEIQAEGRRKLFLLLEEALTAGNLVAAGHLLVMANGTAGHDRTAAETVIAKRARQAAERVRALPSSLTAAPDRAPVAGA
ncbi:MULTISPECIES: hypothetical protein [unclassified Streptomyces]|uniref:hypothetical protein n=1 Tax=unclassified Streptomyces TaxID=2593676 RepID=UPI0032515645